jgi:hypothetical protein
MRLQPWKKTITFVIVVHQVASLVLFVWILSDLWQENFKFFYLYQGVLYPWVMSRTVVTVAGIWLSFDSYHGTSDSLESLQEPLLNASEISDTARQKERFCFDLL